MKVLISEEHPERERLALMFLKTHLERAGHVVELTNPWDLEPSFTRFDPDMVVDNLSDSVGHFVGKWSALGSRHRNVNLIWEQAINPLSLFRFRFDNTLMTRLVDGRVAWGDAFRDILLAENPSIDASRVRACGSIKHAVYAFYEGLAKDAFRDLYPKESSGFVRRVLFVDSFPAAKRDAAADRAMRGHRAYPYMFEVVTYLQALKQAAVSFFRTMAEQHPDTLFTLRLHPTKYQEYAKEYASLLNLPNVVQNADGDIGPLIFSSDLVIAARSGTLVDAHFLGVPAVNLSLERHPFVEAGVVRTMEEEFAPSLAIDEGYDGGLESLLALEPARPGSARRRWFSCFGGSVFDEVVRFLEDIAERPALPKMPALERFADPFVAQRYLRNRARLFGVGGDRRGPRPTFDYERVFARLCAQSEKWSAA